MDIDERYKYLRIMQVRYKQAEKTKGKTGAAGRDATRDRATSETSTHVAEAAENLTTTTAKATGEAQDYICAKRLKGVLVYTAEQLARYGELHLSPQLKGQLESISTSSIRRHLPKRAGHQAQRARQRFQNVHQRAIPIEPIPWNIAEPGHFELDLIHHCGDHVEGEYVYTLQVVDVATGWSGRRAIFGRSYIVVADALYYLGHQIPFPYRKLHPDNGSEFLNDNLLRFLEKHYPDLQPTRSAPGKPNDNRFVEQKNSTLVRAFLGDVRLDTVQQTRFLNRIYDNMHTYHNFIQPVMHQADKQWVSHTHTAGGYTRRFHDDPVPPVVRLCNSHTLSKEKCADLLA